MSLKAWIGLGLAATVVSALLDRSDDKKTDPESKIYAANPLPNNGPMTSNNPSIVNVRCENCGAEMHLNNERTIIRCPYCESSKLFIESDAVQVARDRHKIYSEVEKNKQDAYSKIAIEREKTKQQEEQHLHQSGIILFIFIGVFFLLAIILLLIPEMNKPDHSNEIQIPSSAKDYKGEDAEIIANALEALGFENIETEALGDLKIGLIKKENTIDSIYINGNSTFEIDTWFPSDAQVTIYYHSFPKE